MTSHTDELAEALQENLKLRRELATEMAEVKGEKLPAVRYRLARIFGAFRYAFFGRSRRASLSATVVELMTRRSRTPCPPIEEGVEPCCTTQPRPKLQEAATAHSNEGESK